MIRWVKVAAWTLMLMPLGWNSWLGFNEGLGPDPGKALVDSFGLWALRLLLVTLALRPLREVTGMAVFIQLRRLVGLFSWFYASLHFGSAMFYVVGWSFSELWAAFSEKTYIILGIIAWILMVPLGVTSNRWSQRKLGRDWRRLHQAVYPLAILACLHFLWLVRSDYWQPALYSFALLALLVWRSPVGYRLRNEQKS